jgi:predicted phage tail component-like protein
VGIYDSPFTFGGVDLYDFIPHPRIQRPISAPVEVDGVSMPSQPGETYVSAQYQPMEVTVTGNLPVWDVADVPDMADALAMALSPIDGEQWREQKLVLPDRPGRWWYATCVRKEIGREAQRPPVSLTFRMSDPIAYGELRQASISSGTSTLTVDGTYRSYPERIITSGGTSAVVICNDKRLQPYTSDGALSGSVTFYPRQMRTVVGSTETAITLVSDYWALVPGENTIYASSSTTIEYYERWQ